MDQNTVNIRLLESIKSNSLRDYQLWYMDNFDSIKSSQIRTQQSIGRVIYDLEGGHEELMVALLLTDGVNIEFKNSNELSIAMKKGEIHSASATGTLPVSNEYIDENGRMMGKVAYALTVDPRINTMLRDIDPLLRQGLVTFTPSRKFIAYDGLIDKNKPKGGHNWRMLDLTDDSPLSALCVVEEGFKEKSIDIESSERVTGNKIIKIGLPKITKMPVKDYAKLLVDEQPSIVRLRKSIKDAAALCARKNNENIDEIVQDIIRPEVMRLEIQYKKVVSGTSYKVAGASVAAIGASLIGFATGGLLGGIAGTIGVAGVANILKEIGSFKDSIGQLRENPFYIMWRLQKHEKS